MKCSSCGVEVKEAKFCSNCGAPMQSEEVKMESVESAVVEENVETVVGEVVEEVAEEVKTFTSDENESEDITSPYADTVIEAVNAEVVETVNVEDKAPTAENIVNTLPVSNVVPNYNAGGANTNKNAGQYQYKSKIVAGLLGIFLGGFGVHNFYLGYTSKAIIQLSVSVVCILLACCTAGFSLIVNFGIGIWGLVEGILILVGSINKDGQGMPLKEDV